MPIRTLDQNEVNSIYNKFLFTANTKAEVLDKKTVVSISNNLTSLQNSFNLITTSISNINKLTNYESDRKRIIDRERTLETRRSGQSISATGSIDFSNIVSMLMGLSNQLEKISDNMSDLDLSDSSSCDTDDIDIDGPKKKRRRSRRGSRRPRVGGSRVRLPRISLPSMGTIGRIAGPVGVGLDVVSRIGQGQGTTRIAVGVGGGLAGGALGAKGGAAAGGALGALFGGVGAIPGAAIGGAVGGIGGYFAGGALADKGYQAVTKPQLSETGYSAQLSNFITQTIENASAFVGGGGSFGGGGATGEFEIGDGAKVGSGGPLEPDAGVLDAIAKAEGTYGTGYNTSLGYGKFLPGGKEQNLTGKTLEEILELGYYMRKQPKNPNSSALGRYQIVGSTLKDAAKSLNLDLKTTKFTPEVQDQMAMWILNKQGFGAWEGFKRNPQYLEFAQTALKENRIKGNEDNRKARETTEMLKSQAFSLAGVKYKPTAGSGIFGPPVANMRTTSGFGARDTSNISVQASGDHKGIDFGASNRGVVGDQILASDGGRVTEYTGRRGGLGNIIEIDHGNGYKTRYAHLLRIGVNVGDIVNKGDVIGLMGSTGRSEAPHLHFEIFKNGKRINPEPLLSNVVKPTPKSTTKLTPKQEAQLIGGLNYQPIYPDPRKRKSKTVIIEKPVQVPVYVTKGEPRMSSQPSSRKSGNKLLDYYI